MKHYIITEKVVKQVRTEYWLQADNEKEAIEKYKKGEDIQATETTEKITRKEISEIEYY